MPSETLEIIVRLRDQASRGFRALGMGLDKMRSGLGLVSRAVFSLQGAIAGLGVGLLAKSFTNAASTAESYRTRLNVLLRSQSEGNRLFKEMSEFAGTVSFQYEEIMGAATNLAGVMKGGVDEIKQWMPGIADLAAASGLGIQDTTQQIIRMYSAGAASADLFRERGVLAMLGFQAGVSYSAEETRKRLMEVFNDPLSQVKGAATELAKTWDGMLSMMADRWFQFRNMVMEAGVFDYMKAAISLLLDYMDRLQKEGNLEKWAKELAGYIIDAMEAAALAVGVLIDSWRGLKLVWIGLKGGFATFMMVFNQGMASMAEMLNGFFESVDKGLKAMGRTMVVIGRVMSKPATEAMGKALVNAEGMADATDQIAKGSRVAQEFWGQILDQSGEQLENVVAQGSALIKVEAVMAKVRDRAAEYAAAAAKASKAVGGGPTPEAKVAPSASLATILKSQLTRGREVLRTGMVQLQALYDQGEITMAQYFAQRKEMLLKQFGEEIAILEQRAVAETEINKRTAIEDQIFALRQAHTRQILALDEEQRKSAEALANDRLKLEQTVQQGTAQGLATLEGAMTEAYDLSGEKISEFFYIGKAASVAQATMSTYEAAQKAYGSLAGIPYVGPALGIAAATAAIAQGLARVTMIRRQRLGGGGEVGGYSPTTTADNIPAWLTANEFVQPVDTVRYYGKQVMEGLRRKAIPREIFAGISLPQPRRGPQFAFATGGTTPASAPPTGAGEVKILNFVDPQEMLSALDSPEGDDAIVNVISKNSDKISRVLR